MGRRLPPDQLALYKRIDGILWKEWDPIGISDIPEARDEYYDYLPQVFKLAIEGASAKTIAEYLHSVETETMGLSGNLKHCKEVANIILRDKEALGL